MKHIDEKTVIHCPTPEDAAKVLSIFVANGLKWNTGDTYSEVSNYHFHKSKTCYHPTQGLFSRIGYYEKEGYKIITAQEFIKIMVI